MEISLRHTPSFGVARVMLAPNESVKVESGAMYAMSAGVTLESKMDGGFLRAAKRAMLGGESFFVSTFTAPAHGGFVDVAARLPGDLITVEVAPESAWFVQKGSWLASAAGIDLDTKWGGFKNLFGSEGGFILRTSGTGALLMSCYGALETWDLQPGQTLTVDSGHMVAYEERVQMTLRKATGGLVQSLKSGEGFVLDFVGPGKVMTQTRNPNELLGWISAALGTGNAGGVGPAGALGGVFGRD
ncbi:MAG TPA: TIGR00266 family protein [Acidimicrobiales bacterium]